VRHTSRGGPTTAGTRRLLVAVVAAAVLVGFGSPGSYAASPGGPTRGDAQGIFQAFFTGGSAIRAHNHQASGVPGVPGETTPDGARIYPLLDDLQYCDDGWHVVLLGYFDDPAFYAGGNKELFDFLSAVDIRFALDGVPLTTERTAIKRLAHTDPAFVEEAFVVGFGAFLPPGSLSLGPHELLTTQHVPEFGDEEFVTPFTVIPC
jgi:hypothetical protein